MFKTVLIAGRGEIALRVARTCRELGIRTVAVHSTVDRDTCAVEFADEAVQIGPAPTRRSYMNPAAIIEAALRTGADAIHPGYGFLSEDPDFAEICEASGITLIAPPARVLAVLGDKAAARKVMAEAKIPILPGSEPDGADNVLAAAEVTGFPLIIKPVSGGGGKGMVVVSDPRDLRAAYAKARTSAYTIFGDGRVYLERYIPRARHVEVQILADQHGGVMDLGARDCSVQRRQQKLIEESPPPGLSPALIEEMAASAVRGGRSVGYVGAGTLEFLVDPDENYYFIEINCRIQVEHPVTEMITGTDIVREQLRAAAGLPLSAFQGDVAPRGVAMECRVNVEDPDRRFAPTPGRLTEFAFPAGPFTRVDTYGRPGLVITPDYDSLLAKVIVWAPDRKAAIARMDRALSEFRVRGPGVHTTLGFLREILSDPLFREARHTTAIVDRMLAEREAGEKPTRLFTDAARPDPGLGNGVLSPDGLPPQESPPAAAFSERAAPIH